MTDEAKALLFSFFLLLPALILGAAGGLAVAALVQHPLFPYLWGARARFIILAPAFVAGAIAGFLPVAVLYRFYPKVNYWMIGLLLVVAVVFAVFVSMIFFTPLSLRLSRSLAMEVPGFLFGTFMTASFTRVDGGFNKFSMRGILICLLLLWISLGGPYLWGLAPLSKG